MQNTVNYNGGD